MEHPEDAKVLKTRLFIRIRAADSEDDWTIAEVVVSSPNGRSMLIAPVDGALKSQRGIHVGIVPLSIDYEAETVSDLMGSFYEIEVWTDSHGNDRGRVV